MGAIAALLAVGASAMATDQRPSEASAAGLPEMVVAREGTAFEATLDGAIGRPVATGGVAAVALSRGGTLWIGTNPSPGDEWDTEWGEQWELSSVCGYSVMRQPWPSGTVDVSAGATWPAVSLLEATGDDRDAPSCETAATPDGNLAYMRLFVGSGTNTRELAIDPATGTVAVSDRVIGCWAVSFSRPGGPIACVRRWFAPRGGGYNRVYAGLPESPRLIGSRAHETVSTAIDPTGARVAYPIGNTIWSIGVNGRGLSRITKLPGGRGMWINKIAWSRDGTTIIAKRGVQLWRFRAGEKRARQVMSGVDDFTLAPA